MKKGFTLIELLIVIALLGALAIGLLATIDPFEQLKKGRDTTQRNTTSEFYNANLRYYATRGTFPWGEGGLSGGSSIYQLSDNVNQLIAAGELKDKFMDLAGTSNLNKIHVTSTDATHMTVCFDPESKSFAVDPNTIYDASGGTSIASCKSSGGTDDNCFYCIK
jgi:prepilin-type N-terminal cleavage/methylation domain-containing protein